MQTKTFFLGLVVGHLSGLIALGQQFPIQIPGNPGQDRTDQELGVIQGKVFAADGESPLAKATLSLRSAGGERGTHPRTVRTNARGEYEFKDLKAGKYSLRATRNGYVPQSYGQKERQGSVGPMGGERCCRLGAGEALGGIDFRLIRGGVVEGRVVDQDNEPLSRVSVMLSGYRSFGGERSLIPAGRDQTDDRGRFRIFDVAPGSYFLSVTPRPFFGWRQGEERSFPPTYYPGVLSPQEATKVQVTAGGEVGGFHITMIEALSYSVSGRVLTPEGNPAHSVWITSYEESGDALVSVMMGSSASTDLQGEFKVANLLPGKHRLMARTERGENPQMASATVEVTDRDLSGLTLVLGEGAEITGRIVADSEESALDWRRISLSMRLVGGGRRIIFGGGGARVEEDFTFKISNLMGGLYRFSVRLPPGNHYVESIRVEGQEIIDRPIEMRTNDRLAGVEIRVSSKGSRISGFVQKEEAREAAQGATVLVFADDPQYRESHSRFTRTTRTDQGGAVLSGRSGPGGVPAVRCGRSRAGARE